MEPSKATIADFDGIDYPADSVGCSEMLSLKKVKG